MFAFFPGSNFVIPLPEESLAISSEAHLTGNTGEADTANDKGDLFRSKSVIKRGNCLIQKADR